MPASGRPQSVLLVAAFAGNVADDGRAAQVVAGGPRLYKAAQSIMVDELPAARARST
jgi:hypothetical protein